MAAPDRIERVPSSDAVNPMVVLPPPHVQDERMNDRSVEFVVKVTLE